MYCPFCGSGINPETTFCSSCGKNITFLRDVQKPSTSQAKAVRNTFPDH
uniref:Zinc-ribbon domain-containing protein n=1 Tax=Knipowitschia caucasica TaxID=637954 RepID=A0AAV2MCD5_KNICA